MPASLINSLWFKRDLRLNDHAPLLSTLAGSYAARPLLLLYSFEPTILADPNYDLRHWRFVTECLADLNQRLPHDNTGKPVAPTHEWLPFAFEDESAHDFDRDRAVAAFCCENGIDRPQTQPKKAVPKPKKSKPAEVRAEDIVQHISSII